MQRLRSPQILARLVLAWFVMVVGVSAATPVFQPQALDVICSGGGMKLVAAGGEDGQPIASASLDCPLCLGIALPPSPAVRVRHAPPLAFALQSIPSARVAALAAPALPARGPPSLFA